MLSCIFPLPYVFSISSARDRDSELPFLIPVNDYTFHPPQRGVDLLHAKERAHPEREAGKRDQFAWFEFLDQFKLWLKLLDVLGIIKTPLVGGTRAPNVRARSFNNPRIADIKDHLTAGEVSDHRIEERFHFRFAQVVQHPFGDQQPGSILWNL